MWRLLQYGDRYKARFQSQFGLHLKDIRWATNRCKKCTYLDMIDDHVLSLRWRLHAKNCPSPLNCLSVKNFTPGPFMPVAMAAAANVVLDNIGEGEKRNRVLKGGCGFAALKVGVGRGHRSESEWRFCFGPRYRTEIDKGCYRRDSPAFDVVLRPMRPGVHSKSWPQRYSQTLGDPWQVLLHGRAWIHHRHIHR